MGASPLSVDAKVKLPNRVRDPSADGNEISSVIAILVYWCGIVEMIVSVSIVSVVAVNVFSRAMVARCSAIVPMVTTNDIKTDQFLTDHLPCLILYICNYKGNLHCSSLSHLLMSLTVQFEV